MVGLSIVHVDRMAGGTVAARLRSAGRRLLVAVLRWPWLTPVVPVLLTAVAGQLGTTWLVWTVVGVGLVGLATLLGLGYLGCRGR